MNTLPTTAQVRTWMGLTRQQLLATLVLLALLAAMVIALLGAGYSIGEQAYSTDSSSLIAGVRRNCPCV
jgi:hypothetical protein